MHKQQGMTVIGMLVLAAIVIMLGVVLMRVVPVYMEHYTIIHAIETLSDTPQDDLTDNPMTNIDALKSRFMRQLDVSSVYNFKPDIFTISSLSPGVYKVHLKYQVIKPLVKNIQLLMTFDEEKEVSVGSK